MLTVLIPALVAAILMTAVHAQDRPSERGTSVALPGVRLWVVDTGGSGVPVVLLHAATGSSRVWDQQIPVFTARGFRVISFDRRGWGRSTMEAGAPVGTAADDLLALVDLLKIDRFHLAGTAAGGFVAFDFALSFPDRLRSLVVANSIGGVQDDDFVALGQRIRPAAFNAMPPEVRELGPSYRAGNASGTEQWVALERLSRPPGPAAPAQPLRNRITFSRLETIRTPTLLLTGDADMYAPPPVLKLFAAHIKHAETLVVPEAGHSAYWEQPEIFNRAVLGFIAKH